MDEGTQSKYNDLILIMRGEIDQDSLQIEDDLVRNQFIINQGFEQTVLIESRTEASKFMYARGPPTRNVKMCFTFADGDKRRGRVINFTPNGGINDSPIGVYSGALRMQADKEDQIRCVRSNFDDALAH